MSQPDVANALPAAERDRLLTYVPDGEGDGEIEVVAPFTGEVLGRVPSYGADDVEAAVERAREARGAWAARPISERVEIVREAGNRIFQDRDRLMDVVQAESGKARIDALEEVLDVAVTADYYADVGPDVLSPRDRRGAIPFLTRATEYRKPVGVVGLIAPWNYPLTLAVSDALPALIAGNSVVLKPAAETPFTALAVVRRLYDAGVPRDVFQVVPGTGEVAGEPLVRNADFVGFTGSVAVGRRVGSIAGERLVDASLELGGKNPAIVCADASIERSVTGLLRGCFANAGQLCISVERIYVEEDVYDDFLDRFAERVANLTLGASFDFDADVGSLISEDHLERVESHLADAVDRGATVEVGGERAEDVGPLFFPPTVLTDVPGGADLADRETFGPVVLVEPVPDVETAIERANEVDYGLHASVWSGDPGRGREIATRIEAGTVAVNDGYVATWGSTGAPMGGMKDSGVGRRHGREGLTKYTESQTVAVQRVHPIAPPAGVPTSLAARGLTLSVAAIRRLRRLWR